MADPTVSERRIRPIQDAVATANWKQALQLCDKWQKKGEKSDKFLALKAFILVNQGDKVLHDRGRAEILQLCHRTPAITDLDAIYQLQDALKDLSLQNEEGPKLWDRAVAAKPSDKEILMKWLNRSIADGSWLSAQKATMALRKAFPKERQYDFWNILMCYLVHGDATLPDKDRTLFGTLAYRLISKAAEMVPVEKEQLLAPGKALSTPEELYLLVKVYLDTGHATEALQEVRRLTQSSHSSLSEADPQLSLTLLLETLEASQQWDSVLTTAQQLFSEPGNPSEDQMWSLLVRGHSASNDDSLRERCKTLIEAHSSSQPPIRAACLAKLRLLAASNDEATSSDALLQACIDYSNQYSTKAFCFDDLKGPLGALPQDKLKVFVRACHEQSSSNLNQLFNLKLDYAFVHGDQASLSDLTQFATKALALYYSSLQNSPVCPEAALLAALALLRIAEKTKQTYFTLQTTLLLEICRRRFAEYFPFAILLIQCLLNLGLLSMAMESFIRLSVKNMQWETVGHLLLTRISTLHPAQSGSGEESLNPSGALDAGLSMIDNADQALIKGIQEGFRYGSYANVIDSVQLRNDMEHSINKQVYAIDERKIGRLLGFVDEHLLDDQPNFLVDKRDFSFLANYWEGDLKLQARLRCGPLPKSIWVDAMAQCDHLVTYLKLELGGQSHGVEKAFDGLQKTSNRMKEVDVPGCTELTDPEKALWVWHNTMTKVVAGMRQTTSADSEILEKFLSSLEGRVDTFLEDVFRGAQEICITDINAPGWEYLHASFTQLEQAQGLSLFLAFMAKKMKGGKGKSNSSTKEKIAQMQNKISIAENNVHSKARKLKESINASGTLSKLVDVGLGRHEEGDDETRALNEMLEKICDEANLETLCGKVKDSWEDALEGILAVKVKIYK